MIETMVVRGPYKALSITGTIPIFPDGCVSGSECGACGCVCCRHDLEGELDCFACRIEEAGTGERATRHYPLIGVGT